MLLVAVQGTLQVELFMELLQGYKYGCACLEEVDGRGVDVDDGRKIEDDELEGAAARDLRVLVLAQRLLDGHDVGKVEGRVYAEHQDALHVLGLWVHLYIPAPRRNSRYACLGQENPDYCCQGQGALRS